MKILLSISCLLFSLQIFANSPKGSVWIDAGSSKSALILAHGQGAHPTWLVVNPLRKGVHQKLKYHTLSLQMPVQSGDWKNYRHVFPKSDKTIDDAIKFLKQKGVTKIILMGHSMGSRMVSSYVSTHPNSGVSALIIAGCRNNGGGKPLSCKKNMKNIKIPVLDIWGGSDIKDTKAAKNRKKFVSSNYKQIQIAGADHKFSGYDHQLVSAVTNWLSKTP